jgi:hypothetical protein
MMNHTFLFAGKAIFTVTNPAGIRYTFKVSKPEERFNGEYFASVMKGSDNENDYRYIGMLSESGALRYTKGTKFGSETTEAKVLRFAVAILLGLRTVPEGYTLMHAGKCGRCARTLTVPESIASGIGPECAGKMGLTVERTTKPARKPAASSATAKEAAIATRRVAKRAARDLGWKLKNPTPIVVENLPPMPTNFALGGPAFEMA